MKFGWMSVICVAILGLAVVAEGNVVVAIDNLGPSTWPTGVPPVLAGFTSYRLRMVSDGGPTALITGIDLNGATDRGIFGPLHQKWTFDGEVYTKSEYSLVQNNVSSMSNDSHFLFTSDMIGSAGVLEEDNSGVGSPRTQGTPLGAYWGMGTKLRAAFGINAPYQSTDLAFAYLVLPDGTPEVQLGNFLAEVAVGSEKFTVRIPEPASLSLLVLAGLMLRRR
jgi:hypothetical protein